MKNYRKLFSLVLTSAVCSLGSFAWAQGPVNDNGSLFEERGVTKPASAPVIQLKVGPNPASTFTNATVTNTGSKDFIGSVYISVRSGRYLGDVMSLDNVKVPVGATKSFLLDFTDYKNSDEYARISSYLNTFIVGVRDNETLAGTGKLLIIQ